MVEITSGNIVTGIKYTVGNITTPPGTGTITYNSIVYAIGSSFIGQRVLGIDITTYSATLTAKVYQDDTLLLISTQVTGIIEDEITPYPEDLLIVNQLTSENFSEADAVYPEWIGIFNQVTSDSGFGGKTQIVRKS